LFQMYKAADHLIFNVAPGKRTEVICLINVENDIKNPGRDIETIAYFQLGESG
jgi:hypothetical protein